MAGIAGLIAAGGVGSRFGGPKAWAVLPDGRILYTRWEYVDRNQLAFHHLWTTNPDGTGQMVFYGNQYPGTAEMNAHPSSVPGKYPGISMLDVGCGGGILSESMAALGAVVTGIDMGEVALGVARLHLGQSSLVVDYQQATAEQFAETHPAQFDVVTCLELLEHVPDPASVINACKTLVRPGGDVFFATLNRNLKSYVFAIVGAEYILGLVRKGTHTYHRFIKPAELKNWAHKAGLVPADLCGLHYNPFLRRYSLGGNTHVNYLAHFRSDPQNASIPEFPKKLPAG